MLFLIGNQPAVHFRVYKGLLTARRILVLLLLTGLAFSGTAVFGQTVMSTTGYRPGSHVGIKYKFSVGKAKLPRRHFVDYPKANHSNLNHHYGSAKVIRYHKPAYKQRRR